MTQSAQPDDDRDPLTPPGEQAVTPEGGPEYTDADDERPAPFAGDDDLLSGHLGENGPR